ncbi:MAG: MFS transporter [Bacteroidetes bacterium]|nr:MFS transporter [Bacteroidota bacterium]
METRSLKKFTKYQAFVIAILTLGQFTVILDFMVMAPLSAILLPILHITTTQFGFAVSAYAFSAGISGLLTAGFADKFDRKKLLVFFYSGFLIGTFLCGIAPNYSFLLGARIITGMFGGVIGSIGAAIITDLFELEKRGRVMGFVQMGFSASQVLGLPIGLFLANHFGWHSPFIMIVGLGIIIGIIILFYLQPIDEHLKKKLDRNAFVHLYKTILRTDYLRAFAATVLLATGGFMMMPFGSAFSVNNLGITLDQLPLLYMITGIFSIGAGPLAGRLSDKIGKFNVFIAGTLLTMIIVAIYCNLGITPLWIVVVLSVLLFVGVLSRIIPASALMTAIPDAQDRGAFMSVNASIQQISGGIASAVAGLIVVQMPNGKILHYDTLGYVVIGAMIITVMMMYMINQFVTKKVHAIKPV